MSFDAAEKSTYDGSPVELYEFSSGPVASPTYWRYTSADEVQTFTSHTFTPEVISRGAMDAGDEDTQGSLEVTVLRTNPVAALFIPALPSFPVMLTIYRFHRGDGEVVKLWSGEIAACKFSGATVKMTGMPSGAVLRRKIPICTFQSQCNWALFSSQCGLLMSVYKFTGEVAEMVANGFNLVDDGGHADGYFRVGWAETANGEKRWITDHVGMRITLFSPFTSLTIGQTVYLYPGCDRTLAACKTFNNLQRYGGFPFVPVKNPFTGGLV